MTAQDYVKKAQDIARNEFMTSVELARALDISYNTFMKARRNPETCALHTIRKFKKFVKEWELKNMSATY